MRCHLMVPLPAQQEDGGVTQDPQGRGRFPERVLLLVDDRPDTLRAVAASLELAGYTTLQATTGAEALACCRRHAEHLAAILLDLHLLGEDSRELFAHLRAHRPDLPVILMSGQSEAAARESLGRTDIAGYLEKPFLTEQLLKTVDGALDRLPARWDRPAFPQPPEQRTLPDADDPAEEAPAPTESFERWFLRRVAEAVGSGEVPEQLLAQLRAEFEAAPSASADLPRLAAVREIADLAGIQPEDARAVFGALQQLPTVTQEPLIRRIAEAWLEKQRQRHLAFQQPENPE
jgi:CheY-like chemotaxis protein